MTTSAVASLSASIVNKSFADDAPCDDLVRKLSAISAVLELACQRPELKEELLQPLLGDDLFDLASRDVTTVRHFSSRSSSSVGTGQSADDAASTSTMDDTNPRDTLESFRPPPGLEKVVPMHAVFKVASMEMQNASDTMGCMEAAPVSTGQFESFHRLSAKQLPPGALEQKHRQETARRQTLVLAYLPRFATESDISAAVDRALGINNCVARGRIVRDNEGTSACYGFFEFINPSIATDGFEACRRGEIVIDDKSGHTWHLRASWAKRATVAADASARASRRVRGCCGGRKTGTKSGIKADVANARATAPVAPMARTPIGSGGRHL